MRAFWQLAIGSAIAGVMSTAWALADQTATPTGTGSTANNTSTGVSQPPAQPQPVPAEVPIGVNLANTPLDFGTPGEPGNLKDSDEAVKQADEFHKKAVERFKANDLMKAAELDELATKAAPNYWLPHTALAYLYFLNGGPSMQHASLSVKQQHLPIADVNYAFLMQSMRIYPPATETYKKAASADPQSWRAKLGLAQCLVAQDKKNDAKKVLDELVTTQIKDPEALFCIGQSLAKVGELDKAKELFKSVSQGPPSDSAKQAKVMLFEVAVMSDDKAAMSELRNQVADQLSSRQRAWLRSANLKLATTPTDAKNILLLMSGTEQVSELEYRSFAAMFEERAAQSSGADQLAWLTVAKDALARALVMSPESTFDTVQLAAINEKLGDQKAALKELIQPIRLNGDPSIPLDYYHKRKAVERKTLVNAFVSEPSGYRSYVEAIDFHAPKATCRCKLNSARGVIIMRPGVIDVVIGKGDKPICTVLFDPRKASRKSIFESEAVKNYHEPLEVVGDPKPVKTITELAKIFSNDEVEPLVLSSPQTRIVMEYPMGGESTAKLSSGQSSL